MSTLYTTFGLTLRSDFKLDVLDHSGADGTDVDLHVIRDTGIIRDAKPAYDPYFEIAPSVQYMHWRAIGAFLLEDDNTVRVETYAGISDHQVAQALLGLVISIVLERRQVLCLHASAVNVQARAALFLGDKGGGKSTTSGAMLARGHLPITDDLVAIDHALASDQHPTIRPGFSTTKLWPDSIEALALDPHTSDQLVHPKVTKVQKRMPVEILDKSVPIGAAFVLRRDPEVRATHAVRLPAHDALQMVLRYTFMARYGESKLGQDHLVQHMKRCAGVVAKTPVFDLHIRADLTDLDALTDEISRIAKADTA